jgi:hypothetical protein
MGTPYDQITSPRSGMKHLYGQKSAAFYHLNECLDVRDELDVKLDGEQLCISLFNHNGARSFEESFLR